MVKTTLVIVLTTIIIIIVVFVTRKKNIFFDICNFVLFILLLLLIDITIFEYKNQCLVGIIMGFSASISVSLIIRAKDIYDANDKLKKAFNISKSYIKEILDSMKKMISIEKCFEKISPKLKIEFENDIMYYKDVDNREFYYCKYFEIMEKLGNRIKNLVKYMQMEPLYIYNDVNLQILLAEILNNKYINCFDGMYIRKEGKILFSPKEILMDDFDKYVNYYYKLSNKLNDYDNKLYNYEIQSNDEASKHKQLIDKVLDELRMNKIDIKSFTGKGIIGNYQIL